MANPHQSQPATTSIENPTLSTSHAKYLTDRGVSPDWAKATYNGLCRYRSVAPGDKALDLFNAQHKLPGLLICLPGLDGQTHFQIRPDNPPQDRKFLFPKDAGSPIDLGPHSIDDVRLAQDVYLIEGPVKRDAANSVHPPRIMLSVAGCDCAFEKDSKRQALKPELLEIDWDGKDITLIFDADSRTNKQVAAALRELGKRFQELGAEVFDVAVPQIDGDEHTGIDDWLVAQDDPKQAFLELLSTAKKRRNPTQAKKQADEKKAQSEAEESKQKGQDWGDAIQLEYTDRRCAQAVLEGKEIAEGKPRIRTPLKGQLRVSKSLARFYLWDGTHLAAVSASQVEEEIAVRLDELSDTVPPPPQSLGEEGQKQAHKSLQRVRQILESTSKKNAVKARAITAPQVLIDEKDIQTPPHLIPLPNGKTINFETNEMQESQPEDMIFATLGVMPDKNMETPHWDQFLEDISADNWWIGEAIQAIGGLLMQGKREKQAVFMLVGIGRSGKTLIMTVLRHILADFATLAARGTFFEDGKRADRHDQHFEAHIGKRLVACEDPSGKPQETTLLQYSGRVPIHAERKGGNIIEFMPTGSILITGQEDRIRIHGIDPALQARLRVIPFTRTFAGQEDETLEAKLIEEAPGIAAKMLKCAAQFYKTGLLPHEEDMRKQAGEWASEMDVVGRFLEEKCFADNTKTTSSAALYNAYQQWAEGQGEYVASQRWLSLQLKKPREGWDIEPIRTAESRGFRGITIEEPDQEEQSYG